MSMDWKSLINKDLPEISSISEKDREWNLKHKSRITGSKRVYLGKFLTTEEREAHRKKILRSV